MSVSRTVVRYSSLNNDVTLKSGFGVVQGHGGITGSRLRWSILT